MRNLRLLQTFFRKQLLSLHELQAANMALEEKTYLSIGGGIGSFCWVNCLRVHGVAQTELAVIAQNYYPQTQFKHYCAHSGIGPQDRLRSDSGARPDNFWGFPGYAVDECWDELRVGKFGAALQTAWQICTEPFATDFYTPTAKRVYTSIEREGDRIGWTAMVRLGSALFLRRLVDGRFAVFYEGPTKAINVVVANIVHIALGHKIRRPDYLLNAPADRALSGYELSEDFFSTIEKTDSTILVVGRGIVAARVVEHFLTGASSAAKRTVISLFRQLLESSTDSRNIEQVTFSGWRLQPFNWPRATFGGALMEALQRAEPTERRQWAKTWSASSTPPRKQWLRVLKEAHAAQTYQSVYGQIARIEPQDGRLIITINPEANAGDRQTLVADYLIDCSGFDDRVAHHFIYADLITTYQIARTPVGALRVDKHFGIPDFASERSALFVTGAGAAGNHYGPVDSFLGHQYAAVKIIEKLETMPGLALRHLDPVRSAYGWLQWVANRRI